MKDSARRKAEFVVAVAQKHKATDLMLLDVGGLTSLADYFIICSGKSSRQVQAVAEHIVAQARDEGGFKPLGVEGMSQGHWVLIDFGEVIVHVFHEPTRTLYDLEGLWIEAPRLDLADKPRPPRRVIRRTAPEVEEES